MRSILAALLALVVCVGPVQAAGTGVTLKSDASVTKGTHHYASLSKGCDMMYAHQSPPPGKQDPDVSKFMFGVVGTCNDQDKAAADACAAALPSLVADEITQFDMDNWQKCPLGDDMDATGFEQFWNDVYRAYVLWQESA